LGPIYWKNPRYDYNSSPFYNEILIMGDFNTNILNSSIRKTNFLDQFEAANIFPAFKKSTRNNLITGNDSSIDNIFSNSNRLIELKVMNK